MAAKYTTDKQINSLKIYPTGYYIHYKINGKRREKKISSKDVLINVARNEVRKALGLIAQGIDPFEVKIKGETLNDAWGYYVDKLRTQNRKCVKGEKSEWIRMWDKDVRDGLGKKELKDINRGDVTRLHLEITKRASFMANRVIEIMSGTFNHAISLSLTEVNPCKIQKNPEPPRANELSDQEFSELQRQINIKRTTTRPNFQSSLDFIELCMFTGGRRSEIGQAKWSQLEGNKIILKEHKTSHTTNEDRVIYLSNQAMMVINRIERKGEYILDIDYPIKMWRELRESIGRPELVLHDLRHNFCTMAKEVMDTPEAMKLSGHKSFAAFKRYCKIREPKAIEEMQNVGDHMTKIIMSN